MLLEEQDRSLWNTAEIALGLSWLARSAQGDVFSRYHAEAGIATEHCLAPSFAETRWDRIVECYELLERTAPSVLHTLNRAVAVAEHLGPAHGLAVLDQIDYAVKLMGVDHVGIGSDFDGVSGNLPVELRSVADYPNLVDGLLKRGHSEADVRKILGGNLLRVWGEVEKAAAKR